MQDVGGIGPAIAIGLLIVVMLWFTFGTQRNIRRGNALLTWLQDGLPRIGRRTTLRWLGSSAVELSIAEPETPFRAATIVVVLEPRDVGLLWAFARSRGRRDFLIVRTDLRQAPRFTADVGDPTGWTGRIEGADAGLRQTTWPGGVVALLDANADEAFLRDAWDRLGATTGGAWRLTVQPVVPHFEVHVRPPAMTTPADPFVATVVDIARRVSAG